MQNPESYVAQGKDDTGAAIQLKPFDTSTIFKAYDYQPKKPLLDSLRKDIATPSGAVYPGDRRYVTDLKNKWIEKTSRLQAESARTKADVTPEQRQEADILKMETIDMTSLLQKQYATAKEIEQKAKADPYSYPNWQEKINEYFALPPLERGLSPNIEKAPDVDLNKFFGDLGTAERSGGGTTNRADGSSSGGTYTKFDLVIAKRNFDDLVVPILNSGTPDANRVIASLEKDVRKLAELQKLDYTKLSDVDKMSLVLDVAEDQYMAAQEAKVHTRRTSSTSEANATKVAKVKAAGGGGDASANQPFQPLAGSIYKPMGSNGKILPIGKGAGKPEILYVVQIPIKGRLGGKNDNFAQINKPIKLKITGSNDYAIGTVEIISKYSDTSGKWDDDFWATIVDNKGKSTEVLLDAENMRTFKTEYRIDPQDILTNQYPGWEKKAKDVVIEDPEKSPSWNNWTEDQRIAYKGAYTRKMGAAPTSDPDEEFKRN
jgi:hypothetical protein